MLNIYDIEVNFNEKLYEFFDWNRNDNVSIIRKIPLIRMNNNMVMNFKIKNIKVSNDFLKQIYNKTEIYNDKKYMKKNYACIICSSNDAVAVTFKKSGVVEKISNFMIEDEIEILEIGNGLKEYKLAYQLMNKKTIYNKFLRNEEKIIREIMIEIKKYQNCEEKIKYLYYEWFDKKYDNEDNYFELINDIKSEFKHKHYEFLELLKLFVA